jgi:hypothetical protein
MFEPESFVFHSLDLSALRAQVRRDRHDILSRPATDSRTRCGYLRHDNRWNVAYN